MVQNKECIGMSLGVNAEKNDSFQSEWVFSKYFFKQTQIPRLVIERIATYLYVLETLHTEGVEKASSQVLADRCGLLSTQIRKDISYVGSFGVTGAGYTVSHLYVALRQALGIDRVWPTALVGMGNMGRALLRHEELRRQGFKIKALFDANPARTEQGCHKLPIQDYATMTEVFREKRIEIGIISTLPHIAQEASNALVAAGIKGIINFAPQIITVPHGIFVQQVNFLHHAYALSLHLSQANSSGIHSIDLG